jgi:hypothetical protein
MEKVATLNARGISKYNNTLHYMKSKLIIQDSVELEQFIPYKIDVLITKYRQCNHGADSCKSAATNTRFVALNTMTSRWPCY